jgi:SAM-dependent methyltransferase
MPTSNYGKTGSKKLYEKIAGVDRSTMRGNPIILCLDSGKLAMRRLREFQDKQYAEMRFIIESLSLPQNAKFLDFGCGEGIFLEMMAEKFDFRFVGFDYAFNRSRVAKDSLPLNKNRIEIILNADGQFLPFKNESFDIIISVHVLEQMESSAIEALKEMGRVAKHYIVLMEPSDYFANWSQKLHQVGNGYIRNLDKKILVLTNYRMIDHHLLNLIGNPLNPTAVIVLKRLHA